jgi:hypothetical protein
MITQKQVKEINPFRLDDSVIDELSTINEVEGIQGLSIIDDDLLDEVINLRQDNE